MGVGIFGNDQPAAPQRGRGAPGAVGGVTPAETPTNESSVPPEQRPAGRSNVHRIGNVPSEGPINPFLDTLNKQLTPPGAIDTTRKYHSPGVGTGGERTDYAINDTVLTPVAPAEPPTAIVIEEPNDVLRDVEKTVIQKPFFDWNGTRFNFIQSNYSLNGALQGSGSGITNFMVGGLLHGQEDGNGPSREYQLGLITDPHGRLLVKFGSAFPFISFGVRHGNRAVSPTGRSVDITDVFTQKNTFELQTSRPLWNGAQISINWKTEFTYDERDNLRIDKDGLISTISIAKTGDVSRTFLSIPPIPFLQIRQSSIEKVGALWEEKSSAEGYTTPQARDTMPLETKNRLQTESFMQGFETLPFFTSALREYLPRLNYSFSWGGLEKIPFMSFADRVSLRNGYSGNYKRIFRLDPGDSLQLTTLQTITYGFRPLIAVDMGWDKIWGGRMTGTLNYDTQTEWAADYASNRITKRLSSTFGINVNYQREGLRIPFFNLNLKNTFGATLLISETISSDIFYQFNTITTNPAGTGNGGITKVTIEPRASYDVNQQLTIEAFYRYERTIPAATGLLIPPTRLILAGFDIRLKIF
jgi:hypothetical protein